MFPKKFQVFHHISKVYIKFRFKLIFKKVGFKCKLVGCIKCLSSVISSYSYSLRYKFPPPPGKLPHQIIFQIVCISEKYWFHETKNYLKNGLVPDKFIFWASTSGLQRTLYPCNDHDAVAFSSSRLLLIMD